MKVPGIVETELDGDEVATRVSLGDDEAFVTPGRTVVYRAGGVLSDESVESYPHDASRLSLSEGRRKVTIGFEYPTDDTRTLAIPAGRLDDLFESLVAAVLQAGDVLDDDERIRRAFRFSELTLVITGERLLKHVGADLWDGEYESYHFEDVTGLTYEEGSVATGIVLSVDGHKKRFKAPNDRIAEVREEFESAVLAYRDADRVEELGSDEDGEDEDSEDDADGGDTDATDTIASLGDDIDPLDAGGDSGEEKTSTDESEDASDRSASGDDSDEDAEGEADPSTPFTEEFEPVSDDVPEEVADELTKLRGAVERQSEAIVERNRLLEELIDRLDDEPVE